jgi:hypothetical protein
MANATPAFRAGARSLLWSGLGLGPCIFRHGAGVVPDGVAGRRPAGAVLRAGAGRGVSSMKERQTRPV